MSTKVEAWISALSSEQEVFDRCMIESSQCGSYNTLGILVSSFSSWFHAAEKGSPWSLTF